jgi:hypothetical protein
MEVATIVPTAFLPLVQDDNYHLCLAQLIDEDEAYTSFYTHAAEDGKFIILDNGAAEGFMPPIKELYEKALMINASELILPDKFFDTRGTLAASQTAMNFLKRKGYEGSVMAVPQGKSLQDWVDCALEMSSWGVECIGAPKNLVHVGGPYGRLKALESFRERSNIEVDVHLLGCWQDPREIHLIYRRIKGIRGVDSRMSYLYTSENLQLDPRLYEKPSKKDIDFSDTAVDKELLRENIERWRGYCYGWLH